MFVSVKPFTESPVTELRYPSTSSSTTVYCTSLALTYLYTFSNVKFQSVSALAVTVHYAPSLVVMEDALFSAASQFVPPSALRSSIAPLILLALVEFSILI